MQRYKIVLQQEQRFNLVLPYHDQYSIGIEGLVSILYLDGVPIGMVLSCNHATMSSTVFASADQQVWHFDVVNDVSASVTKFVYGAAGMEVDAAVSWVFNTIMATPDDWIQWHINGVEPDAYVIHNVFAPSCKMVLRSELAEKAVLILQNAHADFKMRLKSASLKMFGDIWASSEVLPLKWNDSGDLDIVIDAQSMPSGMILDAATSLIRLYLSFYVSDWTNYSMSDLSDMVMFDMMYGEVLE